MGAALELRNVWKYFGDAAALQGVDLFLEEGRFLSLFGPNGAGKTTLLGIASTLVRPSEGSIRVFGLSADEDGKRTRRLLGLVSHESFAYGNLSALENLAFHARLYDVENGTARAGELLDRLGLYGRRHDLVRHYSRGMHQRLAIARALLHDPRLLLLDEPFTGLDHHASLALRDLLATLSSEGRTVVMTTHRLDEGLSLADSLAIMAAGRIVHYDSAGALDEPALERLYCSCVGHRYTFFGD